MKPKKKTGNIPTEQDCLNFIYSYEKMEITEKAKALQEWIKSIVKGVV